MQLIRPRVLLVDNYDSFTFNLVQILREHGGCRCEVAKHDRVGMSATARCDGFLFSPGPGLPEEAPVMAELLQKYQGRKSFLGICLGHQAIAEAFGMKLQRLGTVRHGLKAVVRVEEPADCLFQGIPARFTAGLYHSWAVADEPGSFQDLRVTARGEDGMVMALAHRRHDIRGVQFHPESYLTECGVQILHNWIDRLAR